MFVIADNIFTHRRLLRPYHQFLRDASNGFQSETLIMRYGVEYSVRVAPLSRDEERRARHDA